MKLLFVYPSIGGKEGGKVVRTWQMQPLSIAVLKSLTPKEHDVQFFDERIEEINFGAKADLVAISVETYTAQRAYEISQKFRENGIKVVLGGFHPTLYPKEAMMHADSIVTGPAENSWRDVLKDFKKNCLKRIYYSKKDVKLAGIYPDRSIFQGKNYLPLELIETGRGCKFNCEFCSIASFYKHRFIHRPIEDVISEIKSIKSGNYFFVDDNICTDTGYAKKLFKALIPLKISWISQATQGIADDYELLSLMKKSGCMGVLIGFESLNAGNLKTMKKGINLIGDRQNMVDKIHAAGIHIYATFVFGYDYDTPEIFEQTLKFVQKNKFLLAAFNHLVPFPGTPIYERLKSEKKLMEEKWWLDPSYSFGDVAFKPKNFTPQQLSLLCYGYRKKFYSVSSIIRRCFNFRTNFSSFKIFFAYFYINYLMRKDVKRRQGIPIGKKGSEK